MSENDKTSIFLIDGKPLICSDIQRVFPPTGFEVKCFQKATECLNALDSHNCDLLITELKIHDADIVSLLKEIKTVTPWLPVLVITAHADVPSVVSAVRTGAEDVIEKPCDDEQLRARVKAILDNSGCNDNWLGRPLSRSEMRVLELVVDAKSNKEIAHMLHRSVRTVEVHRSHIMRKLGANNLIDLVKRAAVMGIIDLPAKSRKTRSRRVEAFKRA